MIGIGGLVILLVIALFLVGLFVLFRALEGVSSTGAGGARRVLDERYARGEISREEYGRMRRDIES